MNHDSYLFEKDIFRYKCVIWHDSCQMTHLYLNISYSNVSSVMIAVHSHLYICTEKGTLHLLSKKADFTQ